MLEKFRDLSFNMKITVTLLIAGIIMIGIFSFGLLIKSLTPEQDEKQQNSTSGLPTSQTTETATAGAKDSEGIIKIELESDDPFAGYKNSAEIYKYFTQNEIDEARILAGDAHFQLCIKNPGDAKETIMSRIASFFKDPEAAYKFYVRDSVLESKCEIGAANPVYIDVANKTLTINISGIKYTIDTKEKNKPSSERIIAQTMYDYNVILTKENDNIVILSIE